VQALKFVGETPPDQESSKVLGEAGLTSPKAVASPKKQMSSSSKKRKVDTSGDSAKKKKSKAPAPASSEKKKQPLAASASLMASFLKTGKAKESSTPEKED
jgi:hypothetical protein